MLLEKVLDLLAEEINLDLYSKLPRTLNMSDLTNRDTFLQLDITNKCNFRCTYCYRRGELGQYNLTKTEALTRLKKFILIYKPKKLTVEFYGGEPLLNIDAIKYIIDNISEPITGFFTITNCSVYSDEIAYLINNNILQMDASIDAQKTHNKYRVSVNGHRTFDAVLVIYSMYVRKGIILPVRSSIVTLDDIEEFYNHIIFMNNEFGTSRFITNIVNSNIKYDVYKYFVPLAKKLMNKNIVVCPFSCAWHESNCPLSISTPYNCDETNKIRFEILINGDIYTSPYFNINERVKIGSIL